MKIDITEDNAEVLRFSVKGMDAGQANTLRRMAMSMVKTFAIDTVTFYENTSAMFDEYIAHRIGLVPITTPYKGYNDTDEIMFTLDATGPKIVYSEELESADKLVKAANEKIPIIKLAEGQRLRVDGKAVMQTGAKHAKFLPGVISYEEAEGGTYKFYVESFGQMQPKEMIIKAIDAIREELKGLKKEAAKL